MSANPRVYSYLRFSDPRQASGGSVDRQLAYARKWATENGMSLDEDLTLRDEGLSAFHQRHVKQGALGVFLRAIDDGHVTPGSVLIAEGLDRLSRAEPIQAQAQLAQIINAGITVVTASDNREYNRDRLKAQPMDLVYSLLVMIRAHEESDTKSKRVTAAIRRQCEAWVAGNWRGIIRNGHDPDWVKVTKENAFELVEERVIAIREMLKMFKLGHGATHISREFSKSGLKTTNGGNMPTHMYKMIRNRALIGERCISVSGQDFVLKNYYPPVISDNEFAELQHLLSIRKIRTSEHKGITGVITGLGITYCGYGVAPVTPDTAPT